MNECKEHKRLVKSTQRLLARYDALWLTVQEPWRGIIVEVAEKHVALRRTIVAAIAEAEAGGLPLAKERQLVHQVTTAVECVATELKSQNMERAYRRAVTPFGALFTST